MNNYTDLNYPQSLSSPKIVPNFEAHFTDPTAISGTSSQSDPASGIFDGGLSCINSSGVKTPSGIVYEAVSGINASGSAAFISNAPMSFLRPRHDFTSNLNIPRISGLSNSYESISQDLLFNKYIHYAANPNGGQGLIDKTSFAVETDITYSRNINIATYSPYSITTTTTTTTTTTAAG
ncbi:hypothetical protein EB118_22815 [bacterium]|nr:hypothetical protein [bacterium]NDG32887.1 hypothetical protein [bacterium]